MADHSACAHKLVVVTCSADPSLWTDRHGAHRWRTGGVPIAHRNVVV